jgi:hypothetical protein
MSSFGAWIDLWFTIVGVIGDGRSVDLLHSLSELVKVWNGEGKPLAGVDSELPGGSSVTASFGTVDFEDVHATLKLDLEVKLGGFSSLPDILGLLLHDLSVEHRHSSETEVGRDHKLEGSSVDIDWEGHSVIESDVLSLSSSAELPVGDLSHSLDVLLTVALS